jgi:hypothetical protein
MTTLRITKRTIDVLQSSCNEFTVWDNAVTGFGVRVRPTGGKCYVVVYRAGAGRGAPVRRYTIAAVGKITPERARTRAKIILGAVGTIPRTKRPMNAACQPSRSSQTASCRTT